MEAIESDKKLMSQIRELIFSSEETKEKTVKLFKDNGWEIIIHKKENEDSKDKK